MRRVQRDDLVEVLTGKDRGKRGQVRTILPQQGRVVVQGINVAKRHQRPTQMGSPGGIIEVELPLDLSNVAPVCESCNRWTRVAIRNRADGTKVRFCKRCEEEIG